VLLAGLVIEQDAFLQRIVNNLVRNFGWGRCSRLFLCEGCGNLEHVIAAAGVAAGITGDLLQTSSEAVDSLLRGTILICERAPQEEQDLIFSQRFQNIDAAA